jgi:vitamin B12 transporter
METITVSATPISIDDAGSSINVVTREQILARNASSIQSLLREIPGFAVSQQGSSGAVTQLRVRGAEANQVLVLIDGIEANDMAQGSEFDFSQISTNDIERIEIVRGPQSALWGSDAMAGVVHIITRPDTQESGFNALLESGSFSTHRATFSARHATSRSNTKFSVDHIQTDGTNISRTGDEEDGFSNLTLGLSGGYKLAEKLQLDYSLRHSDRNTEFDGTDFFTTGLPVDADNETDSTHLFAGINVSHEINQNLNHAISISHSDSQSDTSTASPVNDETRGTRDVFRYKFNMVGLSHRLSLLTEYESEDYEQRGAVSFFGDPNQNLDATSKSLAIEYRYDADRFNFSFSSRRDSNSEFDDASSWRTTASYDMTGSTRLFASVGESVKNPTFTERFGYFSNFIGNPDLEPEKSLHWEIGARQNLLDNRLNLALTYFQADLQDEINGFMFDPDSGGFTSANIDGNSQREGMELAFSYAITNQLDIRGSYTYLDATQEDFSSNDVSEVRRPEHSGSLSANYRWQQATVNLAITYTGKQQDDFFPPYPPYQARVDLDAFTLISLSGHYAINNHMTLTARLENISDENYEQVYGFESPGFGGYVGIRFNW